MNKRTHASVTDIPCTCRALEQLSANSKGPIKFDPVLNEYHFEYLTSQGSKGAIVIYHCIFCGGALPESKRDSLFVAVPGLEMERLSKLTAAIKTIEDAHRILGVPDFEDMISAEKQLQTMPLKEDEISPTSHRSLTYNGLSNHADVYVNVFPNGKVQLLIAPKAIKARQQ